MNAYETRNAAGDVNTGDPVCGVSPVPSVSARLHSPASPRPPSHAGMTMIELAIVIGIVTILMALVVGLSRHVNEVVKIRRAQTDLGEWHQVLHTWYLKYGMYPDPMGEPLYNTVIESNLFWLVSQGQNRGYYATDANGNQHYFCSLMSHTLNWKDPWGTPYIYRSATNAYTLLSCGPDGLHQENGELLPSTTTRTATEPNTDDITFEP